MCGRRLYSLVCMAHSCCTEECSGNSQNLLTLIHLLIFNFIFNFILELGRKSRHDVLNDDIDACDAAYPYQNEEIEIKTKNKIKTHNPPCWTSNPQRRTALLVIACCHAVLSWLHIYFYIILLSLVNILLLFFTQMS